MHNISNGIFTSAMCKSLTFKEDRYVEFTGQLLLGVKSGGVYRIKCSTGTRPLENVVRPVCAVGVLVADCNIICDYAVSKIPLL